VLWSLFDFGVEIQWRMFRFSSGLKAALQDFRVDFGGKSPKFHFFKSFIAPQFNTRAWIDPKTLPRNDPFLGDSLKQFPILVHAGERFITAILESYRRRGCIVSCNVPSLSELQSVYQAKGRKGTKKE